jgi:hypothetical protein
LSLGITCAFAVLFLAYVLAIDIDHGPDVTRLALRVPLTGR